MSKPRSHNVRVLNWMLAIAAVASPTPALAEETKKELIGYMGVGGTPTEFAHVLGFINPDGTEERYPDFKQPDQWSWVFGPLFSDGERIILCSYEKSTVSNVRAGKVTT